MTKTPQRRHAPVAIWSGLIVVTVLLASRRAAGQMDSIASSGPCVVVSGLAVVLSGLAWWLWQREVDASRSRENVWVAAIIAWLPTWCSGVAVMPADSPFARGWLFAIAVGSGCLLAITQRWSQQNSSIQVDSASGRSMQTTANAIAPGRTTEVGDPTTRPEAIEAPVAAADDPELAVFDPASREKSDGVTTQWMTRQTLDDGAESLEGSIRVSFAAGQRAASAHVPFAPPFAGVPQVECELVSGDAARWKVSVVYPYGMRVEIKRDEGHSAGEIELGYSAICEPTVSDAA